MEGRDGRCGGDSIKTGSEGVGEGLYLAPDDPEEQWNPEHSIQDEECFSSCTFWIDVTIS